MKTSYNSLLILLTAGFALPVAAQQKDSAFIREMTIEKEYNPIVRDADKITRMPEVEAPKANKTRVEYAIPTLNGKSKGELLTLEVGDVNTSYPFSKKRGYLDLAGGNYLNLRGNAGMRFIDTDRDIFGMELQHASSRGDVKFSDKVLGESKRKTNENFGNLYYSHRFENLLLNTNISYDQSKFNYYGKAVLNPEAGLAETAGIEENEFFPDETLRRFHLGFSIRTREKGEWDYNLGAAFTAFSMKELGMKEKTIGLDMGISKQTSDVWRFGMDLGVKALSYGGDFIDSYENRGTFKLRPAMIYSNGSQLKARLGINADIAYGDGPNFGIAPDIRMTWEMADHWVLYADLTGGLEQYSINDLTRQNRYYFYSSSQKNSYTPAALNFGIRSNALAGFWFELYGKLGYTKNMFFEQSHIYCLEASVGDNPDLGIPEDVTVRNTTWQNAVGGYTADAFAWKIGVKMNYRFSDILKLNFMLDRNGWNVEDDGIASYKPGWEMKFGATIQPIKPLSFDLSYDFLGDRKGYVSTYYNQSDPSHLAIGRREQKLDNISQLNLRANYAFNETFALNASLNNLLFRKQSLYYGMPDLGFHFLLGGSIRF